MPDTIRVELRCNKNNAGTYNAHLFVNGKKKPEGDWQVHHGTCDAIGLLYAKIKKEYPSSPIQVKGLDKPCMDQILRS